MSCRVMSCHVLMSVIVSTKHVIIIAILIVQLKPKSWWFTCKHSCTVSRLVKFI